MVGDFQIVERWVPLDEGEQVGIEWKVRLEVPEQGEMQWLDRLDGSREESRYESRVMDEEG